jgi:hypothetical protein
MSWRSVSIIIGVCFIFGLLIAPTIRPAQACSCLTDGYWDLELESIDGDGDDSVEAAFWEGEAILSDTDLVFRESFDFLPLRRVQ